MEKNEFIASDGTTIVFGGGANLPNAPESWEQFYKWVDEANKDKDEYGEPYWGTDCHFKLDYDGPLVTVSSRFLQYLHGTYSYQYLIGWATNLKPCGYW